jgi:hypothetical protein
MPAWSGGPCPQCGEEMPPNLVHCQICRALLNTDLNDDSVEIPEFQPLQEIVAMVEVELRGYYISCPSCQQELRIARKYVGKQVQCKICRKDFRLTVDGGAISTIGFFADCPHCKEELRSSPKYLGMKVVCKHCRGHIHFVGH